MILLSFVPCCLFIPLYFVFLSFAVSLACICYLPFSYTSFSPSSFFYSSFLYRCFYFFLAFRLFLLDLILLSFILFLSVARLCCFSLPYLFVVLYPMFLGPHIGLFFLYFLSTSNTMLPTFSIFFLLSLTFRYFPYFSFHFLLP